jgi:ribosomal protein L13E
MHHIKPKILKPDEKQRLGKGFSREELKKAGVNIAVARSIELPIDMRRRTVHDENVEAIKTYAAEEKNKRKTAEKPVAQEKPRKQAKEKSKS